MVQDGLVIGGASFHCFHGGWSFSTLTSLMPVLCAARPSLLRRYADTLYEPRGSFPDPFPPPIIIFWCLLVSPSHEINNGKVRSLLHLLTCAGLAAKGPFEGRKQQSLSALVGAILGLSTTLVLTDPCISYFKRRCTSRATSESWAPSGTKIIRHDDQLTVRQK